MCSTRFFVVTAVVFFQFVSRQGYASNPGDLYSVDPIVGDLRYVPPTGPGGFTQGSPVTEYNYEMLETRFQHVLTRTILVMQTEATQQIRTSK